VVCVGVCPGQALVATEKVAELHFTTLPNNSALVPLRLLEVTALRDIGLPVDRVAGRDGRVVIIGNEPLLEAWRGSNASTWITLYGKPGASYQITSNPSLPGTLPWQPEMRIGLADLFESFPWTNPSQPQLFFRAYEFQADPPILELLESGEFAMYGQPGNSYSIERTEDLTGASGWIEVKNLVLIDSFIVLEDITPEEGVLFRARRQ
jgi:hypothetical protein